MEGAAGDFGNVLGTLHRPWMPIYLHGEFSPRLPPCPHLHTMRFGGTAKVLLKCKLKYYRISECCSQTPHWHLQESILISLPLIYC